MVERERKRLFKGFRRFVSLTLVLGLTLSMFGSVWAAGASDDDLKGHWAEQKMRTWVAGGLLTGYGDGSYQPDRAITRAEFMTLVNRSFALTAQANISFTDLKADHWAYSQIAAAVQAGYVKGYEDGTVGWNKPVSREESAVMAASLLKLDLSAEPKLEQIVDGASVSAWSKSAVAALVEAGIMKGDKSGKFAPKGKLTRAEAVTLLDGALAYANKATAYTKAGTYGPETGIETIKGNVVISAAGVTLQNVVIEGDLTVTEAVGEGDVFFKKVEVKGNTTIQGGGANSVHFEDSVLVRIVVDKRDGSVRVVVAGATSVQQVIVGSPVKLEESDVTDSGFQNVELSKALPGGSQVQLIGTFENVQVLSSDIKISIPSGTIGNLQVDSGAGDNQIDISKNAAIVKLVLDAAASLVGQGKVENATVNKGAEGTSFETKPDKTEGSGATSPTPTPVPPVSGGGGGSVVVTPTPTTVTPTPTQTTPACSGEGCRDALLAGITVGDFELQQLDAFGEVKGKTGFDPAVMSYRVVTERDMENGMFTIALDKPEKASIEYYLEYRKSLGNEFRILKADQSEFQIPINALEDTLVSIVVISADKLSTKQYSIKIEYPRTVQEGFKIKSTIIYTNGPETEEGYSLVAGSLQGTRLVSSDSIEVFANQADTKPLFICAKYYDCVIPQQMMEVKTGEWFIKVFRNNEILSEGTYSYNFNPVNEVKDNIGFSVKTPNKEELKALALQFKVAEGFSHGHEIYLNSANLIKAVPNVKYSRVAIFGMNEVQTTYPIAPLVDMLKQGTEPAWESKIPFNGARMVYSYPGEMSESGTYTHISNNPGSFKSVEDFFVVIGLFDSLYQPIGYHVIPVTYDDAHVADGYTPVRNWQPSPVGPEVPAPPVVPTESSSESEVINLPATVLETL
jgi:hypothetical protein